MQGESGARPSDGQSCWLYPPTLRGTYADVDLMHFVRVQRMNHVADRRRRKHVRNLTATKGTAREESADPSAERRQATRDASVGLVEQTVRGRWCLSLNSLRSLTTKFFTV